MASDTGSAPTTERGTAVASVFNWTGVLPWSQFMDDSEKAPDLQWPRNIQHYDMMRNDAQCQGLYLGATAALRRYGWYIDPNECDPFYTGLLAADLNLPMGEEAARDALAEGSKGARLRSSHRFGWYHHLAMLLRALYYGHFYFEQVGDITNDGPNGREVWRLRKLGPRHPRTLTEIKVADDGGLVSITQGYGTAGMPPPEIPVDRLVAYVWDQDPGNWVGRSIFRPMYRNWLIKDRLLRVDAIKHERNGVGMPVVEAPPGATKADILELDNMAQEYKAGERGGGAVPNGTRLRLVGTEGSIPDTIASIRFQNEEMARSMLMMFMQLGQTETGSRALGQTFVDWFAEQQTYIADWVVGVTTEHVVEDWWDWNVDPTAERTPRLGYIRDEQSQPARGDFSGAQLPDEVDRAFKEQQEAPGPGAVASRARPRLRAQEPLGDLPEAPGGPPAPASQLRLPAGRNYRRQPYPHELRAGTDFEGMDDDEEAEQHDAEAAWEEEEKSITEKVTDAIKEHVDPEEAAKIAAEAAVEAAAAAAASAATGAPGPEAATAAGAAAAETVFHRVITNTARSATNRVQNELVRQGLVRAILYGNVVYWGLRGRSPAWDMAVDFAQSLRKGLAGSTEQLTSRLQHAADDTEQLAERIKADILGRKDVRSKDQIRGMIHSTTNQARIKVYEDALADDQNITLYASELLDINTCPACAYIDGQVLSVTEARRLYASGGYLECDGGPRCRGTVVGVYEGERSY